MARRPSNFTVRLVERTIVAPAEPTPWKIKELSDVDFQGATKCHTNGIWFYHNRNTEDGRIDPAKVIREALSKALVFYYPFAGRIRRRPHGLRPVVECNAKGVLFAEADAQLRLDELGDALLPPVPCADRLLQNVEGTESLYDTPLLVIQVTRFLCGGFAVAIRLNHIIADVAGLVQLLKATGEIAWGAPRPSLLPVWKRKLLQARHPPIVSYLHREYDNDEDPVKFQTSILRCFFLSGDDLGALKNLLPENKRACTSLDVLTAVIWRCRVAALGLDPELLVRVIFHISGRGRCAEVVPAGYYGNSFAHLTALSTASLLLESPLYYAVDLVINAKSQMCSEYLRSTADLIALEGSAMFTASAGAMIVSDLRGLSMREVDFGWGDAVLAAPMDAIAVAHFCFPYTSADGEEGVVVMLRLPAAAMQIFADELESMVKGV